MRNLQAYTHVDLHIFCDPKILFSDGRRTVARSVFLVRFLFSIYNKAPYIPANWDDTYLSLSVRASKSGSRDKAV